MRDAVASKVHKAELKLRMLTQQLHVRDAEVEKAALTLRNAKEHQDLLLESKVAAPFAQQVK